MKTFSFLNNLIFKTNTQPKQNNFSDNEIDVIKKIWDDLVKKSFSSEGIGEDIFNSFTNIDGLFGIRLFETFDSKNNKFVDFEDFIIGLEIICFDSIESHAKFLFKLFDVNKNLKVEKNFMNIIINSIPHNFICKCSQENNIILNTKSDLQSNSDYEIWTNNCICKDAFNKFDTNHHDYLDFNEFEQWIRSNEIIIKYIRSKINFSPQLESKRKKLMSKTDILPITMSNPSTTRYESYMWKLGKKTKLKIKRYFLLYGSCLYYYKSKSDFKPNGVIFLTGSNITKVEKNFLLISELNLCTGEFNNHQKKLFECESEQQRDCWFDKLQKASLITQFDSVYELGEQIGFGGFSSVFKCKRIQDNINFAVKIISKTNMKVIEKLNLKNEISILKLVSHPNIIHMDAFFETQSNIYFVFELIEDGDLFNNINNRSTFKDFELKKLVKTIAECLAYLHELGIVHRDIKPENILWDKNSDRLVLTDFGLAKVILPNSKLLDTCGTLDYVAPEIINLNGYGDESDIWSLGIIMYLVYYGKLPFTGNDDSETIYNIIYKKPILNDSKNYMANDLILKLLDKNQKTRITAKEILSHPFVI